LYEEKVYAPRFHAQWLDKITEAGVRRRAEFYAQQFDALGSLCQQVRRDLLAGSETHSAWKLPRQIPCIDPIRAAPIIAILQTPHRFRSKRQLWTYVGFGIETYSSAEHRYVDGKMQSSKK
jgi:transposase